MKPVNDNREDNVIKWTNIKPLKNDTYTQSLEKLARELLEKEKGKDKND